MTDNIWTSYAERRPTKEDADKNGYVIAIDSRGDAIAWHHQSYDQEAWARTADVLPGYVKPRKLHPAWRELRADSWHGCRVVWTWRKDNRPFCWNPDVDLALEAGWTHWQPCDPPKVWEDE